MRYEVFFSEDGACTGTRFRLFTAPPSNCGFDEEYAILTKTDDDYHVEFYQHGKSFEFCGAGALCIANYFRSALEGRTDHQVAATIIHHSSHSFSVFSAYDQPMVALPIVEPDVTEDDANHRRCSCFIKQDVQLLHLNSVTDVQNFVWPAANITPTSTLIALHVNSQAAQIHFRYYTSFNDKGEDQATGSLFRYLGALHLPENTWFDVTQCSSAGARMRCIRHGRQCYYTGQVRRIAAREEV